MLQHKAALVVDSGLLRWFVGVLSGLGSRLSEGVLNPKLRSACFSCAPKEELSGLGFLRVQALAYPVNHPKLFCCRARQKDKIWLAVSITLQQK